LCTSLQVLNHMQDCAKDLAALDRCYIPGIAVEALRGPATTPELRAVFDRLLDHVDELNRLALDLPRRTRSRRLRLETAVIVGLAHRLAQRLRHGDPLARRVRLTKGDAAASIAAALRWI
jgi:farnesyl-diphosphate farnesyltransferase